MTEVELASYVSGVELVETIIGCMALGYFLFIGFCAIYDDICGICIFLKSIIKRLLG